MILEKWTDFIFAITKKRVRLGLPTMLLLLYCIQNSGESVSVLRSYQVNCHLFSVRPVGLNSELKIQPLDILDLDS